MHTVKWTNQQVMAAYNELHAFKQGTRTAAVGHKAAQIRRALQDTVDSVREAASALVERYRKELPDGNGGTAKLPAQQDGQQLPVHLWCSDVAAYAAEDKALLQATQELHVPVRFTLSELQPLQDVRGEFYDALYDVIEVPETKPQPTTAAAPPAPTS